MREMKRFIFCFNQISYTIACELARRDKHIKHKIYFCPNRITGRDEDKSLNVVAYNRVNLFIFFCLSHLFRPDEVVLPHFICKGRIKSIAKLAKNISLIDDGLDTFRNNPKNITPLNFKKNTKYYTFNYQFSLANWLENFSIDRVCDIQSIALDIRPNIQLNNIQYLLIQSPGLTPRALNSISGNILIVNHPVQFKNSIIATELKNIEGKDVSIESSLLDFTGEVLVGESMVMIYALSLQKRGFRLKIHLSQALISNLTCLDSEFKTQKNISITLNDGD